MKTVVAVQDLVDLEIRPDALAERFRELTRTGVEALAAGPLVTVACPACGHSGATSAYTIFGLSYVECSRCGSLYVSPRPDAATLALWAQTSPAAVFWREEILGGTMPARRAKLMRPRAEWVADGLAEHRPGPVRGLDLHSSLPVMADEIRHRLPMGSHLESADIHGAWPDGPFHFVTAFDVFDRAFDLRALVQRAADALDPGGLLFLTAPNRDGFDIETLGDRAPALMPPDKLNVLSLAGFSSLFSGPVWSVIELSTPGMFDVETVRQTIAATPDAEWPRAIRSLTVESTPEARLEFQAYLQRHRRTSFARLLVQRSPISEVRR
jgi:SAM-dependent methyltransferase